ncbi:MAG: hypothetical protein KBF57_15105 [Saprospiraceae bacterium]|nr:hypothetical protein [Saprospiraceae bacterium]
MVINLHPVVLDMSKPIFKKYIPIGLLFFTFKCVLFSQQANDLIYQYPLTYTTTSINVDGLPLEDAWKDAKVAVLLPSILLLTKNLPH